MPKSRMPVEAGEGLVVVAVLTASSLERSGRRFSTRPQSAESRSFPASVRLAGTADRDQLGEKVNVKVFEVDSQGRVNLTALGIAQDHPNMKENGAAAPPASIIPANEALRRRNPGGRADLIAKPFSMSYGALVFLLKRCPGNSSLRVMCG